MIRLIRSEQRTDMIFQMQVHRCDIACRARSSQFDVIQSGRGGECACNEVDVFGGAGEIPTDLGMDRVV